MKRIPQGIFTNEFKEEVVRMVTEDGLSRSEVGRRLSIPKSTLAHVDIRGGIIPFLVET